MERIYQTCSLDELRDHHARAGDDGDLKLILRELSFRKTRGAKKLELAINEQLGIYDISNGVDRQPVKIAGNPRPRMAPGKNREKKRKSPSKFKPITPQFPLTDEQAEAVNCFLAGGSLKVTAFAGTGKTSTLVAMAGQTPRRGLYLAFNKSIASEASSEFPQTTDCRTTHSVACRAVRASYKFSQSKLFDNIGPKQLAEELEITERAFGGKILLASVQQAHMILGAITRYCQSGDENISIKHIRESGRLLGLDPIDKLLVKEWVLAQANCVWKMMKNPDSSIPLGHDGYLKMWSLSNPVLDHDYIFLDEAQDTNEVVMKVLENQKSQLVLVGDSHQQIYAWRGAVDAMDRFDTDNTTHLTQSFRFGATLASAAKKVLRQLNESKDITGNSLVETEIVEYGEAQAVLTRTNSAVIEEVVVTIDKGFKPHIVGGIKELKKLVSAVFDLQKGLPSSHSDFFGFNTWDEVVEFSDSEEGEEIRSFVSLVQQHGVGKIYRAIKDSEPEENNADVVISTAHKAKGRQWDSVKIANDFGSVKSESGPIPEEEIRLFYVAITRAKRRLVVPSVLLQAYQDGDASAIS